MAGKGKRRAANAPVSEIGKGVPKNLRFGLIVAVAIFWAEALRTLLKNYVFVGLEAELAVDLSMAVIVAFAAYIVFIAWRRIDRFLDKTKIPKAMQRL